MARKRVPTPKAIIEVYKTRRHRWQARKRYRRGGRVQALAGKSYSTRMNARRAARKQYPELPLVSV